MSYIPTHLINNKQSGITLLLAILVLAAITAIAFSLAAIVTIEIRSSGDVLRTEPALYAVQGVVEEAFFKYSRSVGDTGANAFDIAAGDTPGDTTGCVPANSCTTGGQTTFNGVSLTPIPMARQFDPAPRVDIVPPNSSRHYLFIDPTNPNPFPPVQEYSSVTVTALNTVASTSAIFTKCCDPGQNPTTVQTYTPLVANTQNSPPITDTKQYFLEIRNNNATIPLLVNIDAIKTVPVNGQTHVLPLFDKTLDITASYLGLTRKYTVNIPLISFAGGGGGGGSSTQNVAWTNIVGASASGNSLTKTGAVGWNAGASSTQAISSGDGYVEFTASETNLHRRLGLSNGDSNQSWDDIDYCIYLSADGTVYINEDAVNRGNFGAYATGDVFRVAVEGGAVRYRRNGTLIYSSTVTPAYPLLSDTSLYSTGSTLNNVVISGNLQ